MSLLYGCEAWFDGSAISDINKMYMKSIKMLLGVRATTTSEVCLLESGYPSLKALVRSRQNIFISRIYAETKVSSRRKFHLKNFIDSINTEDGS